MRIGLVSFVEAAKTVESTRVDKSFVLISKTAPDGLKSIWGYSSALIELSLNLDLPSSMLRIELSINSKEIYSSSICLTTSIRILAAIKVSPFWLLRIISFSPIMNGMMVLMVMLLSLPRISNPFSVKESLMFCKIGNSAFGGTAFDTSVNPLSNCSLSIINLIYLYLLK